MSRTLDGVIAEIAAERKRQIEAEGWTPEHDDAHDKGELARAADNREPRDRQLRDQLLEACGLSAPLPQQQPRSVSIQGAGEE